jgi:peptidoglycan hydrolase CwlO-like protein
MKEKTFLGINLKNWLTILGLVITVFILLLSVSAKINSTQSETKTNSKRIEKCEVKIQGVTDDISEMQGDVKEINGKLDILILRTK